MNDIPEISYTVSFTDCISVLRLSAKRLESSVKMNKDTA